MPRDVITEEALLPLFGKRKPHEWRKPTKFHVQQPTQCSEANEADGRYLRKTVELHASKVLEQMVGAKDLSEFKKHLARRYGSLLRAWLMVFDKDGTGRVCASAFYDACRSIGYIGNLRTLWNELDSDRSQFVTIDEVDPDAVRLLGAFQLKCESTYGNVELAFEAFSARKRGHPSKVVDHRAFGKLCRKIGFTDQKEIVKVFHYFDLDGGGDLEIEELAENPLVALMVAREELEYEQIKNARTQRHSEDSLPETLPPLKPWWVDFPPCPYLSSAAGRRLPRHLLRPPCASREVDTQLRTVFAKEGMWGSAMTLDDGPPEAPPQVGSPAWHRARVRRSKTLPQLNRTIS
jgi:Ca2+-binding EF-hand superfamily protein